MALTPAAIERKLIAFIEAHIPAYLTAQEAAEAAEDPGRSDVFPLPPPKTIVAFNSEQRFAEDQLPAVVLRVGINKGQHGMSRTTWDVTVPLQVAVLAAASEGIYARDNAGTYIAALRWLFTTQQTVDGLASGVEYLADGLTEPFTVGQSRHMAAGELDLSLLVRGIADRVTVPGAQDPVASTGVNTTLTVEAT